MILLIDNYDSFSYNVYQLIGSIATDIKVIRNDELSVDEILALKPSHIIISPGPGSRQSADPWYLFGPSGDMRNVRRDRHLRETAYARQAIDDRFRCELRDILRL